MNCIKTKKENIRNCEFYNTRFLCYSGIVKGDQERPEANLSGGTRYEKHLAERFAFLLRFLAIEIVAVAFMSTYPAGSAAMMLLGLLALVIGGAYTVLLGRDIVNLKL